MSSSMSSPGVYIKEVDWSAYVSQASTCIIGLVMTARRGPTVPTLITSQKDLIATFGEPVTSDYGGYSAYEVLSKANQVYIQRALVKASSATAGTEATDKLVYTMLNQGTDYNKYKIIQSSTSNTEDFKLVLERPYTQAEITAYTSQFTDKGTWLISTAYKINDLVTKDSAKYTCIKATTGSDSIEVTNTEYWKLYADLPAMKIVETYDHLSLNTKDNTNFVLNRVNTVSNYIKVALLTTGTLADKELQFSGAEDGAAYGTAGSKTTTFSIQTKYYDSTLEYYVVKFSEPDAFGYFTMTLYDPTQTIIVEQIKDLSLDSTDDHYVDKIVSKSSKYILVTYNPTATEQHTGAYQYIISGGQDGVSKVTNSDIIDGLEKFSNPETYDINLLAAPGWYDNQVIVKGTSVAETRADCMFITGTPAGLTPQEAIDYTNAANSYVSRTAMNSSYSAVYWPWLKVSDSFKNDSNATIWLPPEGPVLAQFAYSDSVSYPWYSPAGLNRGMLSRVLAVEYNCTKGERDTMYGNRNVVNPIISYKSYGITIWGQKTTQRKASAVDRINVRRAMNYIEKIISAATDYFVFDPNDKTAWARWKDMIDPKLTNIKTLRGIVEFKTVMKPTTDDIENNTMPGAVYIKPTKDAEFIPISFILTTQGYDFTQIDEAVLNS